MKAIEIAPEIQSIIPIKVIQQRNSQTQRIVMRLMQTHGQNFLDFRHWIVKDYGMFPLKKGIGMTLDTWLKSYRELGEYIVACCKVTGDNSSEIENMLNFQSKDEHNIK